MFTISSPDLNYMSTSFLVFFFCLEIELRSFVIHRLYLTHV
ncbi:BnaA05g28430D [Brassica napus]|uniref:BnaA05g28430D protein n=1 Tax=Brassica napus TaxID=3708 RepID=A0A078F687_BRANA|nr:BnaA05g28430D [Brassica napus]